MYCCHLLLFMLLTVTATGDLFSKRLLRYIFLSQLAVPQKKLVIVPIVIPIPMGWVKNLFRQRPMKYLSHSGGAEIVIHANGCRVPSCGKYLHSFYDET
ncbi:hypothetical protein TNCT_534561 [Trichonephila clavata]|uniref:Secreted protein n=1 Tax=Trichonephila clavata TaxID=2740835 RepID=A0A8X6L9X3_TRICU|nr:hypothetical protein TNCT_534561 [Trichonephila clavata]